MDRKTVEKLEASLEDAIIEVVGKMGVKRLALLPPDRTMHSMANAAVVV